MFGQLSKIMPKEWLETSQLVMEGQCYVTAILCTPVVQERTSPNPQIAETSAQSGRLQTGPSSTFFLSRPEGSTDRRDRRPQSANGNAMVTRIRRSGPAGPIHNYYFETVDNLEKAIMTAVDKLNRQKNHPFRLHLQTAQSLLKVA